MYECIILQRVITRRPQTDAVVVVRAVVIRDVAVIRTVEINPGIMAVTHCPSHRKPRDVHPISSHVEHMILRIRHPDRHHIRTLADQREPLVHGYILNIRACIYRDRVSIKSFGRIYCPLDCGIIQTCVWVVN